MSKFGADESTRYLDNTDKESKDLRVTFHEDRNTQVDTKFSTKAEQIANFNNEYGLTNKVSTKTSMSRNTNMLF